jgi:hypothetical protein
MVENDPLIIVRKAKAMIIASSGISDSQDLVRAALKALGYSRIKRVLVHTRSWSIEIATLVFLERCDLHEAQGRRLFFFSRSYFPRMRRSKRIRVFAETEFFVRTTNSKRAPTSSSVRTLVDAFVGLSFSRREGVYISSQLVESWKIVL